MFYQNSYRRNRPYYSNKGQIIQAKQYYPSNKSSWYPSNPNEAKDAVKLLTELGYIDVNPPKPPSPTPEPTPSPEITTFSIYDRESEGPVYYDDIRLLDAKFIDVPNESHDDQVITLDSFKPLPGIQYDKTFYVMLCWQYETNICFCWARLFYDQNDTVTFNTSLPYPADTPIYCIALRGWASSNAPRTFPQIITLETQDFGTICAFFDPFYNYAGPAIEFYLDKQIIYSFWQDFPR